MSFGFRQSLSCGLRFEQRQSQRLSYSQKQSLRFLLEQRLLLKDPVIPNAVKGIPGLLKADQLLREQNAHGVLVGGLARAVWMTGLRQENDYLAHKDVDVAIIYEHTPMPEKFYGGIDWWHPKTEHVTFLTRGDGAHAEMDLTYWQNGNGCVLRYSFSDRFRRTFDNPDAPDQLAPGLYIMDPEFCTESALKEAASFNTSAQLQADDLTLERFKEKIFAHHKHDKLNRHIAAQFAQSKIVAFNYERDFAKVLPEAYQKVSGL